MVYSKFYYGFEVTQDNQYIDFDEGGPELSAAIEIGSYTLTELAQELAIAMNAVGGQTYTVTVDRATRKLTISAPGNFTLKITNGSHLGTTAYGLIGFTGSNRTGDNEYEGNNATGSVYTPQFPLQSYIDKDSWEGAVYATVAKSASGKIQVVSFGKENFFQFDIKFSTNQEVGDGSVIRYNATGVEDLTAFMRHCISKAPFEFIPDEDDPDTFHKVMLESTPDDSKGLSFKLKELYAKGLYGFFDTGNLKLRYIED